MKRPEIAESDEWLEWYRLTPSERWRKSNELRAFFLMAGGNLEPEPDSQSPFNAPTPGRKTPADGRPGVRLLRRS
jgi:hypothetical protein